ncbi:hypothetical protein VNO77_40039 [Canavalia gladiata]|uniref:Uncharacterized protein n=1 Tax=Canavalia gladiata TaxID=3824 RepID=A0AAN9JZQ4_CANGL
MHAHAPESRCLCLILLHGVLRLSLILPKLLEDKEEFDAVTDVLYSGSLVKNTMFYQCGARFCERELFSKDNSWLPGCLFWVSISRDRLSDLGLVMSLHDGLVKNNSLVCVIDLFTNGESGSTHYQSFVEHGIAVKGVIGDGREILVQTSIEFPCPCNKNHLGETSDIIGAII